MRRHLVEQQDRRRAEGLGHRPGVGEDQADQQRLLLAGRAERAPAPPWRRRSARGRRGAARPASARPRGRAPGPRASAAAQPRRRRAAPRPRARARRAGRRPARRPPRAAPAPPPGSRPAGRRGRPSAPRAPRTSPGRAPRRGSAGCARAARGRSRPPPRRGRGSGSAPAGRGSAAARPAPSSHSRSIAGVSQSTRATAPRAVCGAGLPSISTCRPAPSDQVATSWPSPRPSSAAATFQPMLSGVRAISSAAAPRRPRPGESSDTASIRLVLPAPFGPKTATGRPSSSSSRRAVRAEMREAEPGDGERSQLRPASASRHRPRSRRCPRASASGRRPS